MVLRGVESFGFGKKIEIFVKIINIGFIVGRYIVFLFV